MIGWLVGTGLGRSVSGALAIVLAVAAWTAWQRHQAAEIVRDEIEEQTDELGDDADAADLRYLNCLRRGGLYDFATGRCGGLQQDPR